MHPHRQCLLSAKGRDFLQATEAAMSIEELVAVVPPPDQPNESGPLEAISAVESALGTSLPKDVVDFGIRYGTGMFADTVEVFNPFSSKYLESVREVSDLYRDLKRAEGD